ncbi:MAG: RNA polymerase sigma factor, partial [Pseudomonadales bacterium]
ALIARDELNACMQQLIEVLPDMQSATLNLRENQGYSLAEICNILDVSESNVRVLLHRARQRLFRCIEHFQATGECCTS